MRLAGPARHVKTEQTVSPPGYHRIDDRRAAKGAGQDVKNSGSRTASAISRGKLPGSGAIFSRYISAISKVNAPGRPEMKSRAGKPARTLQGVRHGDHVRRSEDDREDTVQPVQRNQAADPRGGHCQSPRTAGGACAAAGGSRQAWIWRAADGVLTKRQCSVMAALETAAHPHHTEAKPETVSRAMITTAIRLTMPNSTTLR